MYVRFQVKVFNSERLKKRVNQNSSFQMNDNKPIVSALSFHNNSNMRAPHKTEKKNLSQGGFCDTFKFFIGL